MKINIRTRLTFQFTYIVTVILILFSFIIYYFSADYREYEFYSRLKQKAINTAKLLIEVKEVDYNLLKIIDKNTINTINNEKVLIYDFKNLLIYNSSDNDSVHTSKTLLEKIRLLKMYATMKGKRRLLGYFT